MTFTLEVHCLLITQEYLYTFRGALNIISPITFLLNIYLNESQCYQE